MSKSASVLARNCRKHGGWFCPALSLLIMLGSPGAAGNTAEPKLRRSEQLDVRRLDRVSEDERSALRVAWRAAQTGADEARSVQEMLDSLRRMESSVNAIGRLVRDMPVAAPLGAPAAVEPAEPAAPHRFWALTLGALLALLAIWWFRRRRSVQQAWISGTPTAEAGPLASALDSPPAMAPPVDPLDVAAKPPRTAPRSGEPGPDAAVGTPPIDPWMSTVVITPPPAARVSTVDFSLEAADPETVARTNARIPVPRTRTLPRVPERRQELHVEPTLQLAEIMLSMGLQQGAAKALVEYVEAHPREAVYHWLKLLAIYRDGGQHKDFEETAAKLRKHFNIHAEESPTRDGAEAPTLESFPRVARQVQQSWSRPDDCIAYLQHLLKDNRDGERIGFPQPVAEEFLLLIEVLKGTSGAAQSVRL